jgi:diketogulonate reductase-like aldo/keto reductase
LLNLLGICKIKPVAIQVEFQPYLYRKNLKDFYDKENIAFISYFPLDHGANARAYIAEHNGEFDFFEEEIIKE